MRGAGAQNQIETIGQLLEKDGRRLAHVLDGIGGEQHLAEQQTNGCTHHHIEQTRRARHAGPKNQHQHHRHASLNGHHRCRADDGAQQNRQKCPKAQAQQQMLIGQLPEQVANHNAQRAANQQAARLLELAGQAGRQANDGGDHGKRGFGVVPQLLGQHPCQHAGKRCSRGIARGKACA